MFEIGFASFNFFEVVISFQIIWFQLYNKDKLTQMQFWTPIALHYFGFVLKQVIAKRQNYKILWIICIITEAISIWILTYLKERILYIQILIFIQFFILFNAYSHLEICILILCYIFIVQILIEYQNFINLISLVCEIIPLLGLLGFLKWYVQKKNNQNKEELQHVIEPCQTPSVKNTILKLMPWLTDQKFFVLNDRQKMWYDQSDLIKLMEQDNTDDSLQLFFDCKCESLSQNLTNLMTEKQTVKASPNFKIQTKADIREIIDALFTDMNAYYTIFSAIDITHRNCSNIKLNFFIISDNFIEYVIVHFETQLKSNLNKSFNTLSEMNKLLNQPSSVSRQTSQTVSSLLISNMFQSISHEFGTFLNTIVTVSGESIQLTSISQEIKQIYIEPIYINARLLAYILQNIRDFNTILLGEFTLRLQEFDAEQTIQDTLYLLHQQEVQRNNKIKLNCPINLMIYNDLERFKQVIYQLLSNSLRFTLNGTISIDIESHFDKIQVKVTDTGIGMDAQEQFKLLELLKDNKKLIKISKNSVGCGLGLSIANAIVLKMNGKRGIQFVSQQGKGSVFYFSIRNSFQLYNESVYQASCKPVTLLNQTYYLESYLSDESQRQFILNGLTEVQTRMKGLSTYSRRRDTIKEKKNDEFDIDSKDESNILILPSMPTSFKPEIVQFGLNSHCCSRALIVDDEYFNIQSLQLILKKFSIICDFAFNGEEALKKINEKSHNPCNQCQNNGYVIYFLDLNMPVMDGFETVRCLKHMMKEQSIPKGLCIANTGYADLENKQLATEAGMDFYLTKPIKIKELEVYLKLKFPT